MTTRKRVRPTLLVLLWIWAACVFLVVDLFFNVEAFDRVRPRAPLYRGMRVAAHRMVGEPLPERTARAAPRCRRPVDGRALRAMARRLGPGARDPLLACVRDPAQPARVRAEAARLLGGTGEGSLAFVEALLDARFPAPVRRGAVLALAEVGTPAAARRALGLAWTSAPDRAAALVAIGRMRAPSTMGSVVADERWDLEVRIAACRALGRPGDRGGVAPLRALLGKACAPPPLRAEAAYALAAIGDRTALPNVAGATRDASPAVARAARAAHRVLARARNAHR